jgi:hypothetical protein
MNISLKTSNLLYLNIRNNNNSKVALLNKLKAENCKLKDELNEVRKNNEFLDKFFRNIKANNNINSKLTSVEFANIMMTRENELSDNRKILHDSISRIKSILDNSNDEFTYTLNENMKNLIEGKTLEEKFSHYFEKLIKFYEFKDKRELNLRNELESKESKILSLNREIFLRNNNYPSDEDKENGNSSKKRFSVPSSNIINSVMNSELSKSLFKTNYKRKFGEIENLNRDSIRKKKLDEE